MPRNASFRCLQINGYRIASSWEDYVNLAVELGNDKAKYKELRKRLEDSRKESPLFDTRRWVKNWESAILTMVSNYDQDKEFKNVYVKDGK
jgi:predicted O-linked N-acetylglucosamine transferase (SPINDLY family)